MSSPPSSERGFTLLECEIALFVLMLLAFGVTRVSSRHEQIVGTMEAEFAEDGAVFYVDAPDELEERALGLPALLSTDPPAQGNWVDNTDVLTPAERTDLWLAGQTYVVIVLESDAGLDPITASATVELDPLP